MGAHARKTRWAKAHPTQVGRLLRSKELCEVTYDDLKAKGHEIGVIISQPAISKAAVRGVFAIETAIKLSRIFAEYGVDVDYRMLFEPLDKTGQ